MLPTFLLRARRDERREQYLRAQGDYYCLRILLEFVWLRYA